MPSRSCGDRFVAGGDRFVAGGDRFVAGGHTAALGVYSSDVPVSVALVTTVGTAASYWCGFNAHPAPIPGGNTLALWEAMLVCKRLGISVFELGSLEFDSPKQIRIGEFKASFGPRPVYAIGGVRRVRPMRGALLDAARASAAFLRSWYPTARTRRRKVGRLISGTLPWPRRPMTMTPLSVGALPPN
jgi:hypothetical protein